MDGADFKEGTYPGQFHKPSDGIGHLILFPVSELEIQRDRIVKILQERGVKQEKFQPKGNNWGKVVITGMGYDEALLHDEVMELNRAIIISKKLGEDTFEGLRKALDNRASEENIDISQMYYRFVNLFQDQEVFNNFLSDLMVIKPDEFLPYLKFISHTLKDEKYTPEEESQIFSQMRDWISKNIHKN